MRVRYSRYFLDVITDDTNKWTKANDVIEYFHTKDFKEAVAKAKLLALSYGVRVEVMRQEYNIRSHNTEWYCLLLVDESGKVIQ